MFCSTLLDVLDAAPPGLFHLKNKQTAELVETTGFHFSILLWLTKAKIYKIKLQQQDNHFTFLGDVTVQLPQLPPSTVA